MLGFIASLYDDELLYSILGRYHVNVGNRNFIWTLHELFNSKKITAITDLPGNLGALVNNISAYWKYSVEDIAYNHTAYPLYKTFWGDERSHEILRLMEYKSSRLVHLKSGIYSSVISPFKYLRFCPLCMETDIKKYGENYWHRLHQIPGVLVCPDHKIELKNSIVRTYELNPQSFYSANAYNCLYSNSNDLKPHFTIETVNKMAALSEDVKYILNNHYSCSKDPDWFRNTYLAILRTQDLVSWKGKVNQKVLVHNFILFYSSEFLSALNLMPDCENKHNWVSMMVRKYVILPHPIKHLLMIRFLSGSLTKFYSNSLEHKLFKNGPYPCLNGAAQHYMHDIIQDYKFSYSRNKNPIATFSCSCGFVYTRKGPDKNSSDLYKYTNILAYGEVWEKKLRELIEIKKIHLREAAKELKVDLSTIRKYVVRLGINTDRISKESISKLKRSKKNKSLTIDITKRDAIRENWLTLMRENEGVSKSRLRHINSYTYNWLNYHDIDWLRDHSPIIPNYNKSKPRVNWKDRDKKLKYEIEHIVKRIVEYDGKPERINIERLGKELGILYLLRNSLDKLPITKAYLKTVCEDIDSFRLRRFKWKVNKLEG